MATPKDGINGTLGTGLLAMHSFDGDYLDSSGNGNDLTQFGTTIFANDRDGETDKALDGLASSNYVRNDNVSSLNNSDVCFSFWTDNKSETTGFHDVMCSMSGGSSYGFATHRNGGLLYYGTNGNINSVAVPDGWYLATINYNFATGDMDIYINGDFAGTKSLTIVQAWNYINFGGGGVNNSGETVIIDEVRIYNRLLTPSEITEIYTMGVNYDGVEEITISNPSKTSSSLYLAWDTTADYFTLKYKKSTNVTFTKIDNITDNFYNLISLSPLSTYDIVVEGYNSLDEKISEGLNQFSTDSAPIISDEEFIVMRVREGFVIKLNLPHTVLVPNVDVVVKYKKSSDSNFIQLPSKKVAPNDKLYLNGLDTNEDYDIEIEY